jgi:hypothetical protein
MLFNLSIHRGQDKRVIEYGPPYRPDVGTSTDPPFPSRRGSHDPAEYGHLVRTPISQLLLPCCCCSCIVEHAPVRNDAHVDAHAHAHTDADSTMPLPPPRGSLFFPSSPPAMAPPFWAAAAAAITDNDYRSSRPRLMEVLAVGEGVGGNRDASMAQSLEKDSSVGPSSASIWRFRRTSSGHAFILLLDISVIYITYIIMTEDCSGKCRSIHPHPSRSRQARDRIRPTCRPDVRTRIDPPFPLPESFAALLPETDNCYVLLYHDRCCRVDAVCIVEHAPVRYDAHVDAAHAACGCTRRCGLAHAIAANATAARVFVLPAAAPGNGIAVPRSSRRLSMAVSMASSLLLAT